MGDEDVYNYFLDIMYRNKPDLWVINSDVIVPVETKEKVMANVKWVEPPDQEVMYFADLDEMTAFRISGANAVYFKVGPVKHTQDFYMLEVATGKLFKPTASRVEVVGYEIVVESKKPSIY